MEEKQKNKKKIFTKESIIPALVGLAVGIVLTILVIFLTNSERKIELKYKSNTMATVNGSKITAQEVFEEMKDSYGLEYLIEEVDAAIFDNLITLTEEEINELKEQAQEYIDSAKLSGYTEEEYLETYGFSSFDDFVDTLKQTRKKNKYLYNYLEERLEEGAVEQYYNENKDDLETYDSEHILVKISDTVTDDEALQLANEIISKLNEGKTFSEVVEEYKDRITHEELGYQGKSSSLQQSYIDELVALKDGEYSQTPIKTTYGYHIVHKIATSTLEDLRESIIEELAEDTLLSDDSNLLYKAFAELRKEKNMVIKDETLNKQYDNYLERLFGTD